MLITGHSPDNHPPGQHPHPRPLPGKDLHLRAEQSALRRGLQRGIRCGQGEHEAGVEGRFAPGIPRKSDGQLLFLLHMLSKLPLDRPGRIAVIMNGSPLFNGDAGGGESEIRRHLMEHDLVDAIIALPTDMFYKHRHRHLRVDRQQPQSR